MLWQRLFASFDSDRGNLDLIRGTVYGAIMYFGLYRVAFPFVITLFLLLPFSSLEYARWQAAILYAVYSVVIMLMMIQCAQASRDRGINPVFIYGSSAASSTPCTMWGFLRVPSPNRSVFGASIPWQRPRSCRYTFWGSCSSSAKAASSESFGTTRPLRTSSLSCSMATLPCVRQEASSASCPQTPQARIALRAHLREIPRRSQDHVPGEHHPHAQQAHLREARRAQKARAHRHAQGRRAVGSRIPRGERFPAASLSHRPIGRARSDRPHTSRAHRRAP